jgi:WD40 repeat protein
MILRDHDLDEIRIRRPNDLALLAEIEAHDGKVTGLSFSPDGAQLVSGGEDKIAKLWAVTK